MIELPSHPLLNLSEKEITILLQCDGTGTPSERLMHPESVAVNRLFKIGLIRYQVEDGKWVTTQGRGDLVALVYHRIAVAESTKYPGTHPHKGENIRSDVEKELKDLIPQVCALT